MNSSIKSAKSLSEHLAPEVEARIRERISHIPIVQSLGFVSMHFAAGVCEAEVTHRKEFDGIFESFHGGMLMTVADTIACFAIMTLTGAEQPMATTDMNIRFLAPCRSNVRAVAKVIQLGKSLCPVQIDLFDMDGIHVAVAQVTYMRLKPRTV